jgi:hypothetical protein
MNDLKKAVSQEHITEDTVDLQFCSDWLKNEIKLLFSYKEALEKELTEQCRLNGMGSQRELRLMTERDRYRAEAQMWEKACLQADAYVDGLRNRTAKLEEMINRRNEWNDTLEKERYAAIARAEKAEMIVKIARRYVEEPEGSPGVEDAYHELLRVFGVK